MLYNELLFSPASVAGHDDDEAFGRMQMGLQNGGHDWVNISRYLDQQWENDDGTFSAPGTSDITIRHEFKTWMNYMSELGSTMA